MKRSKKIISLILVLSTAFLLAACSKDQGSDLINQEGVIATVNGKAISQAEYDENLAAYKKMVETQYGEGAWDMEISEGKTIGSYYEDGAIMDNMILELVLLDAAEKAGIKITDEELKTQLDTYKKNFQTDDEYKKFLESNGMTEQYLTDAIKKEYVINQYISKEIESLNPTDEELQKLFEENKMGQKVRASHILVNTEDEAKKVKERLDKGEVFEDVAKEVSIDPSKENGGDLDFFSYTDMVKPFSDAAFAMEVGQISGPVQSEFGYHIIKVTDKKVDEAITLESSKEGLVENYKNTKYNELIENLKNSATIEKKDK